jgi:hypothetical protein
LAGIQFSDEPEEVDVEVKLPGADGAAVGVLKLPVVQIPPPAEFPA